MNLSCVILIPLEILFCIAWDGPTGYESLLQMEKVLSQTCLLMDGIMVGVMRLTLSLRQSLDWNSASTLSTQVQLFHKSHTFKEEDVLLLTNGSPKYQTQFEIRASRNVCS
jgi:hypothetical protein